MQKHGIKIAGGHGSQLAGIMIGTGKWPSFFVIIIYCTGRVCYGTTLYLPLIRRIAPHIPLKITTHSFNLSSRSGIRELAWESRTLRFEP